MPGYIVRIEFDGSALAGAEFSRLRRKLVREIEAEESLLEVTRDRGAKTICACLGIRAGSSSRACALGEALGRRILGRVPYVRLSVVRIGVSLPSVAGTSPGRDGPRLGEGAGVGSRTRPDADSGAGPDAGAAEPTVSAG